MTSEHPPAPPNQRPPLVYEAGRWRDTQRETEYQRPIRTLWLDASDLSVHVSSTEDQPKVYVRGFCKVSARYRSVVSSMRDARISTDTFSLTVHPIGTDFAAEADRSFWNEYGVDPKTVAPDDGYRGYVKHALADAPPTAVLAFSPADLETGRTDDWFVEINLPPQTLEALVEAIRNRRVGKPYIGLKFVNLYVDDFHAPLSVDVNWFLPPSGWLYTYDSDDSAKGWVKSFGWSDDDRDDRARVSLKTSPDTQTDPITPSKTREIAFYRLHRLIERGYGLTSGGTHGLQSVCLKHPRKRDRYPALTLHPDGLLVGGCFGSMDTELEIQPESQQEFNEFATAVLRPSWMDRNRGLFYGLIVGNTILAIGMGWLLSH